MGAPQLFALAAFHASLVFGLAGLSRIAGHAGAPLVAALFAAIGRLRLREILNAQANEDGDC